MKVDTMVWCAMKKQGMQMTTSLQYLTEYIRQHAHVFSMTENELSPHMQKTKGEAYLSAQVV